jgi:hypothetical protein
MVNGFKPSAVEADFQHLRESYDHAFHRLALALGTGASVAEAEREYHERRDQLARFLMSTNHAPPRRAIERLAYRLWEEAGRPSGTADADWYRAEALLTPR